MNNYFYTTLYKEFICFIYLINTKTLGSIIHTIIIIFSVNTTI